VSSNVKFSNVPSAPGVATSATAVIAADTESVSLNLSSPVPSALSLLTATGTESPLKSPAVIVIVSPLLSVTVTSLFAA